ncbi:MULTISPECIES: ribosomal protein L7/L12 [unclassified Streptomyces]|uniref:ribosomal protein L7/L12 n=1 Tax=unclassified Streptomyces TaxID=2593676 RepID=UPI0022554D5B|nr:MULTISPECIES: ribosomal protein L7/L12 [unclassified Streptomyces]MCX4972875.1 ribosomal protein L7/L12 [Streptomyces sp. NBC_00620]WUC12671.1 ribosomal protein L7/L12 [Streptomyces sp. NBC_00564]WUC50819.1 ribosomal protein L7/L12 [Streptomyces sp. NBC_00554]
MEMTGLLVIAAIMIASFAGLETKLSRADRRIARVEKKIDLIIRHLGVHADDPELPEVAAFLRDGKKIQAIKAYRAATGAGLQEAKEAVERME